MLVVTTVLSFKQEAPFNGYTITGTIKGMDNTWVKIIERNFVDRQAVKVIDSTKISNGTFQFKGKIENEDMVMLSFDGKFGVSLFLENSTIQIDVVAPIEREGFAKSSIKGSKLNDENLKINLQVDSVSNLDKYAIVRELRIEAKRVYTFGEDHPEKIKMLQSYKDNDPIIKALADDIKNVKFNYIKNNPSSPVSANLLFYIFTEGRMTYEEMPIYYHILEGKAKNTSTFRAIEKKYKEIFESLAVGTVAPDFTLPTVEGGELSLSGIQTKYKLVDFWASWCKPCRASFPHLKELYKRYKRTEFDIVGVDTADDEAKWRKAIKDDKTVWNNLYDSNGTDKGLKGGMGKVALKYGATALPTTFLLDENDKIILRNPTKEELDAKLNELLGY